MNVLTRSEWEAFAAKIKADPRAWPPADVQELLELPPNERDTIALLVLELDGRRVANFDPDLRRASKSTAVQPATEDAGKLREERVSRES